MPNYNKVILIGHLVRDIEMRYTSSGTAVVPFVIAVSDKWKGKDGQQNEDVAFVDCTAFGKQGETIAQYVKKGDALMVEGRLKQDTWDDKETGKKRSKLGVTVNGFTFMPKGGGKKEDEAPTVEGRVSGVAPSPKANAKQEELPADETQDDVPF